MRGRAHKTHFHRPMAFKGSHYLKNGKKFLMNDFCTSESNFKSRWPKPEKELNNIQQLLRSMGDEAGVIDTIGMNVVLMWNSGSDLDIQVMCACGKWHGYGSSGGSGDSCRCDECEMKRDYDIRTGVDDREPEAVEHVIFSNPRKLLGKEIGMACYNWSQSSSRPRNDFKMAFVNEHKSVIYPYEVDDVTHDETWMYCTN